jgi:hypothetical protein
VGVALVIAKEGAHGHGERCFGKVDPQGLLGTRCFDGLCAALAQVNTETILRMVTNPTGGILVGVKITALNELTRFARAVYSGQDVSYLILLCPSVTNTRSPWRQAGSKPPLAQHSFFK